MEYLKVPMEAVMNKSSQAKMEKKLIMKKKYTEICSKLAYKKLSYKQKNRGEDLCLKEVKDGRVS